MKKIMISAIGALMALTTAAAADWPEKPIKIIVPFGAGGTADQVTRTFSNAAAEHGIVSEPMTVINVGGHYSIGTRQAKEAAPDGYTFVMGNIAMMGGEASGAMDFGWRDFDPVAATGAFCVAPVVRKDSGINSVAELLDKAKAEPDTLIFGANLTAINHMAGVVLQELNPGAKFRFVQIGGGSPNFAALTGKQTNASVLSAAEVIKFTKLPDGSDNPESQVKALAYSGPERNAKLGDLPTLKELGYDVTFCITNWWFAPKGTPKEAIDGMADILEQAVSSERVQEFYDVRAFGPVFLRGDALKADLASTWEQIEPIAKMTAKK